MMKLVFVKVGDGYVCLPAGYSDLQLLAAVSVREQEMSTKNDDGDQKLQHPAVDEEKKKKKRRSKHVWRNGKSPESVLTTLSAGKKRPRCETDDGEAATPKKQLKEDQIMHAKEED